MRAATNHIVIHCSATGDNQNVTADDIRRWHKDKGWDDIGYHFVIRRDGGIEAGRRLNQEGAHVSGHNDDTVAVCLVGGLKGIDNFTPPQWAALSLLVDALQKLYPKANIMGHRDFPGVKKDCPSFDVQAWAKARNQKPIKEAVV